MRFCVIGTKVNYPFTYLQNKLPKIISHNTLPSTPIFRLITTFVQEKLYFFFILEGKSVFWYRHYPLYDHPNNIWSTVQIIKLLLKQNLSSSCHFFPIWSKYSPRNLILNHTHSILFTCKIKYQVSNP